MEWNALAVVNDFNADYPLDFYHFFKEIDCRYIQFTPIVERISPHADGRHLASPLQEGEKLADFSVSPEQWGNFLCTLFDEWVREDVGKFFIQLFDSTLANWVGIQPGVCTLAKTCGHAGVMEFNGDVYSCDHFVFPEYKLGNIHEKTLVEMMYSDRQLQFGQMKQDALPRQCKECEFLFACNGECPKNRFTHTADGEPGLNYLCKGYHQFFQHVAPYMDYMKKNCWPNARQPILWRPSKRESFKSPPFFYFLFQHTGFFPGLTKMSGIGSCLFLTHLIFTYQQVGQCVQVKILVRYFFPQISSSGIQIQHLVEIHIFHTLTCHDILSAHLAHYKSIFYPHNRILILNYSYSLRRIASR